jgi:hypothetical protein
MIEDIQALGPELDCLGFAHGKALEQAHIEIGASRQSSLPNPELARDPQ